MFGRGDEGRCPTRAIAASATLMLPTAALLSAVVTFITTPGVGEATTSLRLVAGLTVALVPWALVAGGVRVPWWAILLVSSVPSAWLALDVAAIGAEFVLMILTTWLALTTGWWLPPALVVGAGTAIAFFHTMNEFDDGKESWIFFAAGLVFAWFLGALLRREQRLADELRSAQVALADAAAAEERRRIAREIHDIVGHSLTVVLLNVSGARRALPGRPEAAADALERAEAVGRESLDHVRQVVGLLRDFGGGGATAPLPAGGDVRGLVVAARLAGRDARYDGDDLDDVDPAVGLCVHRIVQEALANAEHHAPGAAITVRVTRDERAVTAEVENDRPYPRTVAPGEAGRAGAGLVGMRERVAVLGGEVSAGPTAGGGWRVRAVVPAGARVAAR